MTRVVLGNRHAIHSRDHGATFETMAKGKRATVVDFDDSTSTVDMIKAITDPQGIWTYHAVGPTGEVTANDGRTVQREALSPDAKPAWVASDSDALAAILAEAFGGVEVRKLEDPYEGRFSGPADAGRKASGGGTRAAKQSLLMAMLLVPFLGYLLANFLPMLKVNTGNDFQYNQMAGSASATAVGKFVGLTANTGAPAAGDTTLTAEITTAGGGLIRKAGTPAHTTSAASYTITTVFTANGSDSLPVTIGKRGIFDAVTAGNLVFETLVSPTATLSASGDALTLTDTISM